MQDEPGCGLAGSPVMEAVREQKQREREKLAAEEATEEVNEEGTEGVAEEETKEVDEEVTEEVDAEATEE